MKTSTNQLIGFCVMERLVVDLFMHNVEKWLNIKVFENMLGHFVALCNKGLMG